MEAATGEGEQSMGENSESGTDTDTDKKIFCERISEQTRQLQGQGKATVHLDAEL